jgi:microcystin-dependent protein
MANQTRTRGILPVPEHGMEGRGTKWARRHKEFNMEPILGEIRLFPFNFVPRGWAACNGALLPIQQNQALFALIGPTLGGDGRTNFALPDLRTNSPLPAGVVGYCIATQGVFPSRD